MIVKSCSECPFYRLTPILGVIVKFLGAAPKSGWCCYERETKTILEPELGLPPGPERDAMMARLGARMIIEDNTVVPNGCPLRDGDLIVTLGS